MSSQVPFTSLTPEAMGRLTLDEQLAFEAAACAVGQDQKPSLEVVATLVLTVQRLITEPARVSEQWAVHYGSDDLNDGKGCVWPYDDEEDARAHVHLTEGACVARRTVLALPWEAVPEAAPAPMCPGGCGCRLGTDDADRSECGCDEGCCGE